MILRNFTVILLHLSLHLSGDLARLGRHCRRQCKRVCPRCEGERILGPGRPGAGECAGQHDRDQPWHRLVAGTSRVASHEGF